MIDATPLELPETSFVTEGIWFSPDEWLLEGIDAEGYDVVVHKVPAVLRFILIHGFGRAYRREAEARWTPDTSFTKAPAS